MDYNKNSMEISAIYQDRLNKLKALKEKGIRPFDRPDRPLNLMPIAGPWRISRRMLRCSAGRLMPKGSTARSSLLISVTRRPKIQVYIKADVLGQENFELFSAWISETC